MRNGSRRDSATPRNLPGGGTLAIIAAKAKVAAALAVGVGTVWQRISPIRVPLRAALASPSGEFEAIAWCNDAVTDTRCDQHYNAYRSDTPGRGLACHESGHAVGLTHGSDASPKVSNGENSLGCSQEPVPATNTGQLGGHNRALIDGTY